MAEFNEIDRRILNALDGRERLKLLLKERGLSQTDFARRVNVWVEEVSMCLRGERPYTEIRDALAKELEIDRAVIDELIDGPAEPAEKSA